MNTYLAGLPTKPLVLEDGQDANGDDVLYPLGEECFAHVRVKDDDRFYVLVEPTVSDEEQSRMQDVMTQVATHATKMGHKDREGDLDEALRALLDKMGITGPIRYRVLRDLARFGPIDALLRDPNLEDVHVVGGDLVHVVHRAWGPLKTNVHYATKHEAAEHMRGLSERVGRPVSDAQPVADAVLPNGSRINIVYSDDVSRRGASMSIRIADADPVTITRLIAWNTISAKAAAYLWLALEHGMSLFACGEAACGKTTTLNALLGFISPRSKIYSAEDTPEVRPPHRVWQRLLTRESDGSGEVAMFDLLRAALRSRPDYIVVGEIRGAEGAVAFQAMQTGHPTVATCHATNMNTLVQRLGSPPIEVPLSFMDNLNVVLFQRLDWRDGKPLRRVTEIVEVQGMAVGGGLVTLPVFRYLQSDDKLEFKGMFNSHILERKIAVLLGIEDPRDIYQELQRRADYLQQLADAEEFDSATVQQRLQEFA